jgi:hypothetical protein
MMISKIWLWVFVFLIAGCSTINNPALSTLRHVSGHQTSNISSQLSPHFQYLRVVNANREVYLALGNVDQTSEGQPVEVWYSANHEVLRISNGHVVGAIGMFTEWRHVNMPHLPPWSQLAASGHAYAWVRERDVMPGYHYGVQDTLLLRAIAPPQHSNLQGWVANQLKWFEEDDSSKLNPLPPAYFAVMGDQVVYSYQCLDSKMCLSWQRWPVPKAVQ